MTLKVMVTGSRDWPFPTLVHEQLILALKEADRPITLIHGDCPTGADHFASTYWDLLGLEQIRYPADWDSLGLKAGPLRNKTMIESIPQLVLAFQFNNSKGTQHSINLAKQHNVPIRIFTGESK